MVYVEAWSFCGDVLKDPLAGCTGALSGKLPAGVCPDSTEPSPLTGTGIHAR